MVGSKEVVKDHEKPRWVKKKGLPEVTKSWHNYMVKKLVQDFQSSTLQISETPYDEKIVSSVPAVQYEFPTGYHQVSSRNNFLFVRRKKINVSIILNRLNNVLLQDFSTERFRIPEALFDPSMVQVRGGMVGNTMLGVGHIVTTSVGMCDVDVRPALYGSVVVTGGNSFIQVNIFHSRKYLNFELLSFYKRYGFFSNNQFLDDHFDSQSY